MLVDGGEKKKRTEEVLTDDVKIAWAIQPWSLAHSYLMQRMVQFKRIKSTRRSGMNFFSFLFFLFFDCMSNNPTFMTDRPTGIGN